MNIVVSGLTRCGSSLLMQMLHAGGMPISCATGNERISGEHDSNLDALREIMLGNVEGKAIKVLDPLKFPIPPGREYIFLWCKRDYQEQAKSIVKFLGNLGIKVSKSKAIEIYRSLAADTTDSIRYLKKLGKVYTFAYEESLSAPETQAKKIASIIGPFYRLDSNAMAGVVIDRSPKCYDGFMENILIEKYGTRA